MEFWGKQMQECQESMVKELRYQEQQEQKLQNRVDEQTQEVAASY
jgi:hypothetical protein